MILFQSSPVEIAKSSKKALSNVVKFLSSIRTFPYFTLLNMKLPMIENIKKISIKSKITLESEGMENMIVCKMACRPSALPARRRTLVTLRTLIILASCGPSWSKVGSAPRSSRNTRRISKIEAHTTKKSNLFQELLK